MNSDRVRLLPRGSGYFAGHDVGVPRSLVKDQYTVFRSRAGRPHLSLDCFGPANEHPPEVGTVTGEELVTTGCLVCIRDLGFGDWFTIYEQVRAHTGELLQLVSAQPWVDPVEALLELADVHIYPGGAKFRTTLGRLSARIMELDPEVTDILGGRELVGEIQEVVRNLTAAVARFEALPAAEQERFISQRVALAHLNEGDFASVSLGDLPLMSSDVFWRWHEYASVGGAEFAASAPVVDRVVKGLKPRNLDVVWELSENFGTYDGKSDFKQWLLEQYTTAARSVVAELFKAYSQHLVNILEPEGHQGGYSLVVGWSGLVDNDRSGLGRFPVFRGPMKVVVRVPSPLAALLAEHGRGSSATGVAQLPADAPSWAPEKVELAYALYDHLVAPANKQWVECVSAAYATFQE